MAGARHPAHAHGSHASGMERTSPRPAGARITRQARHTGYGSRADGATDLEERRWSFGTFHPAV